LIGSDRSGHLFDGLDVITKSPINHLKSNTKNVPSVR
jgi:hypothetical protein